VCCHDVVENWNHRRRDAHRHGGLFEVGAAAAGRRAGISGCAGISGAAGRGSAAGFGCANRGDHANSGSSIR